MTQQYLAGELSLLLGLLQTAVIDDASAADVGHLRRWAETGPRSALASATVSALEVADRACWDSLTRGNIGAFMRAAAVGAQISEFSLCAGLIEER